MDCFIQVYPREKEFDAEGLNRQRDIRDLGITRISDVRSSQLYHLQGELSESAIQQIAQDLLADPVSQLVKVTQHEEELTKGLAGGITVNIWFKPGVMDVISESVRLGVRDLGISGLKSVASGRGYLLGGNLSESDIHLIATKLLSNPLIQDYRVYRLAEKYSEKDKERIN